MATVAKKPVAKRKPKDDSVSTHFFNEEKSFKREVIEMFSIFDCITPASKLNDTNINGVILFYRYDESC